MNNQPSLDAVRQQLAQSTTRARQAQMNIRALHEKSEKAAQAIAKDRELRHDAIAARQSGLRAIAALSALENLSATHDTLHREVAEAERRALPTPPKDAGTAIQQRTTLDQLLAMEEGKQGELLRNSQELRVALFSAGTRFDVDRAKQNPTIDLEALRQQTLNEHAPMLMGTVRDAREAAQATMKTIARAVSSGMTGEPVELGGALPARMAGDITRRYQNLPATWSQKSDPIMATDVKELEQRAQAASGKAVIA
jgi:hypothetical protein